MDRVITPECCGLDYNLFDGNLTEISFGNKAVINTINQYSYCIAEEDPEFKSALKKSDILLPDGEGITIAEKFLTGRKLQKISGSDIHFHLLDGLNKTGGSCFYLGSSTSTLARIQSKLKVDYPNIKVGYFSPPFKPSFNESDYAEMIAKTNSFSPDVLFIGLTAPKQEKLSQKIHKLVDAKIICSIGAVFDFYAGTVKRPAKVFINLKLEWFGRLLTNPAKMWKRYLYYGPIYIYYILKIKFHSV